MRVVLLAITVLFLFGACKKRELREREAILEYIVDNNLDAMEVEEGLFIVIEQEGSGPSPTIDDEITLNYEGFLLKNGNSFDSGTNVTFPLDALIRGWQIGLPYMKAGGSATLLIPSALGYGSQSTGSIPPNSILIFEIDLISVN